MVTEVNFYHFPAVRYLHPQLCWTNVKQIIVDASLELKKSWNVENDDKYCRRENVETAIQGGCPMPVNEMMIS